METPINTGYCQSYRSLSINYKALLLKTTHISSSLKKLSWFLTPSLYKSQGYIYIIHKHFKKQFLDNLQIKFLKFWNYIFPYSFPLSHPFLYLSISIPVYLSLSFSFLLLPKYWDYRSVAIGPVIFSSFNWVSMEWPYEKHYYEPETQKCSSAQGTRLNKH